MSLQPGEPPAGSGTARAAQAARTSDDPGELQVDLEDDDRGDEQLESGLADGVHETDKADRP